MRKALLPLLVALFLLAVVLPGSVISAPPNATPTVVPPSYATYLPLVAGSEAGNRPPEVPSGPSPADGATDVPVLTSLSWTGSDPDGDSLTYDVYLGTATPPGTVICAGVVESRCVPSLEVATTYTWQVVATDSGGAQTSGPVWSFTTEATSTAEAFAAEVVRLVFCNPDGGVVLTVPETMAPQGDCLSPGVRAGIEETLEKGAQADPIAGLQDTGGQVVQSQYYVTSQYDRKARASRRGSSWTPPRRAASGAAR